MPHNSVDRSPRASLSSTHNVVRESCFEALSAFVESRNSINFNIEFACAWQRVGHGEDVWDQPIGGSNLNYWQPA